MKKITNLKSIIEIHLLNDILIYLITFSIPIKKINKIRKMCFYDENFFNELKIWYYENNEEKKRRNIN